jgi:hypothetical protein
MPCRVHMENSIRYHAKKDCMPKCAPCWHLGSRLSSALHARTHDGMMTYTHARTHEFTHARTHACTHARSHARTLVHACTPTNTHAHTRHTHCMRTRSVHGMWHEYQQGWRMACSHHTCMVFMRHGNCRGSLASLSENRQNRWFSESEAESPGACHDT